MIVAPFFFIVVKREGIEQKPPGNTAVARVRTSDGDTVVAEKKHPELIEPHTFAPQDLLALLRNLENEICMCEINLKDENDKQNKYKVSCVIHFFDAICICFVFFLD